MENKQEYGREIEILELRYFRRMLEATWLERQSNEIVLDRVGSHRNLINAIAKRQMSFLAIYVEKRSLKIWLAQERLRKDSS